MDILKEISEFEPFDDSEAADKAAFLDFIKNNPDCLLRSNLTAHVTVSSWIVNRERTKVLFCYHNLYNSWSWVGGHADGENDLIKTALKEAKEETGITPLWYDKNIFSLEVLPVFGHMKKGSYVPSHVHYNVTYLIEADENEDIKSNPEENSAVEWIPLEDIPKRSTEKWITEKIYKKLCQKL